METITQHKRDERIDKLKSATLTALISALLFLLIFYYQFVREIPKEEKVTTMLINFGDNRSGNGAEEPANQEGSLASADIYIPEELKTPEPQPQEIVETPKAVEKPAEKIIKDAKGKITKIDEAQGKMSIDHGPIKKFDMDAMTMIFKAADPAMLKAVKPGDNVTFNVDKVNGQFTVTKIEKAK